MDINDVRRLIESYRAGATTEQELRDAVAAGVAAAPDLSDRYIAVVCASFSAAGPSGGLRSALISIIDSVAAGRDLAPSEPAGAGATDLPPAPPPRDDRTLLVDPRSRSSAIRTAPPRPERDAAAEPEPEPAAPDDWPPLITAEPSPPGPARRPDAPTAAPDDQDALATLRVAADRKDTPVRHDGRASDGAAADRAARTTPRHWLAYLGLAAAIAAAAWWVAPAVRVELAARELSAAIATGPDRFAAVREALRSAPESVRMRALSDAQVRQQLARGFEAEATAAIAPPAADFARARSLIRELAEWLPGDAAVDALGQHLDQAAKDQVTRDVALRDELLQQGVLLDAPGREGAATVQARIRRIDPQAAASANAAMQAAFTSGAQAAFDSHRLDDARMLADAGLEIGSTARLTALGDAIEKELRRRSAAERAAEIEQRLAKLDPTDSDFFDQAMAAREDLLAIISLGSLSPAVRQLQASLESSAASRVHQRLDAGDIVGAERLLQDVADLLPEPTVSTLRAAIEDAARGREARALELLDRLRHAVVTGRVAQPGPSGALEPYDQLQRLGASPAILTEARDLLAYGHVREGRRLRIAGDRAQARNELQAAAALRPGSNVQVMLDAETRLADGVAAEPAGGDLESARRGFADALRATHLGTDELWSVTQAIDRLESMNASAQEVAAGLGQVEDQVLAELGSVRREHPEQAVLLARQASSALPTSERLASVAHALRSGGAQPPTPLGSEADANAARRAVTAVLAHPEATEQWMSSLRHALAKLAELAQPDDPAFVEARRVARQTLEQAEARARARHSYREVGQIVALERNVDALGGRAPARGAEKAPAHVADAAAERAERASIESVKQQLADQAAAGDVEGALRTAAALQRVMRGSLYVEKDVPQALVAAYSHRARSEALAGRVDAALATLAQGRQRFGRSPELRAVEQRYVVVGDAYDRLSTAIALNVGEQRRYLEALKASAGSDYAAIERMLAGTLANRIADERAAGRSAVAANLLDSGKQLFKDYQPLLEHGQAGVLAKSPLYVNPDAATHQP
jgi:hypothetical protein